MARFLIEKTIKNLKMKKNYTDSQLFVASTTLLSTLYNNVKNMAKDDKNLFGYEMVKNLRDSIQYFSQSYNSTVLEEKYKYSKHAFFHIKNVEIILNSTLTIGILSPKQIIVIMESLGKIITQCFNWNKSLEEQLSKSK